MRRRVLAAVVIVLIVAAAVVYGKIDPSSLILFPKCPSLILTGYKCAGCGTQRAIHNLLNFDIAEAFVVNPLFVVLIPFIMVMVWIEYFSSPTKFVKLRRFVYGLPFGISVLIVFIIYTITRNIFDF